MKTGTILILTMLLFGAGCSGYRLNRQKKATGFSEKNTETRVGFKS